jgi:4-amino-4-deoxy-L-arabinose transferase-like glycosyltransferase
VGVTQTAVTLPKPRRAIARPLQRLGLHHFALVAVLALATVLDVHRISQNGYGNIFYSAGVKSMLRSWHNFFFVSFDPGGLVTIDKPPLALWLQALSAKLFGLAPLSLLLPEAIVGVLAVALLYRALARRIGGWAAVAGALALAVFPSFVAVSRTNNIDTLLIALMILACDAAVRACETGRLRTLAWSAVLVGLAFNCKTLAAFLIVPGIAVGYLLCAPNPIRRRLLALVAAGAVLVIVSSAWMLAVELTPASKRPYVGSSTDNSEIGLTFSYNGFGRVGGQTGGPGQIPVGTGGLPHSVRSPSRKGAVGGPTGVSGSEPLFTPSGHLAAPRAARLPNGRERNPIPFGGPVGPLRLFGRGLGDQGAWLLPFALLGLLALALLVLWPAHDVPAAGEVDGERRRAQTRDGRVGDWWSRLDRRRLALLIVFGGWLAVEAAVLSLSNGIVHPYYVSALGPGLAAMIAGGVFAFACFARRRDWRLLALAAAAAATVPVQLSLLDKADYMSWFKAPLIAATALALLAVALATLVRRALAPAAVALVIGVLMIAPGAYSATNWLAPVQSTFPAAGPRAAAGPGGYGVDARHVAIDRALLQYVDSHRPGTRWSVLADASNTASPMILLGSDAGALGGFSGTDPVLDGGSLARLVSSLQARYVLLGGEFSARGGNDATGAVQRACAVVATRAWLPRPLTPNGLILFDCAGHARALARD